MNKEDFVDKWCITEPRGTHGAYDYISEPFVFNTKEEAEEYRVKIGKTHEYYQVMQIWKSKRFGDIYPVYGEWDKLKIHS